MSKNAKEIIKNYLDIKEEKLNFDNYIGSGAAFIVTPVNSGWVFTREILSEDHQLIESSAKEFGKNRILPVTEKLNVALNPPFILIDADDVSAVPKTLFHSNAVFSGF